MVGRVAWEKEDLSKLPLQHDLCQYYMACAATARSLPLQHDLCSNDDNHDNDDNDERDDAHEHAR
eukprot:303633-Chlamydomonas_euryale.AAC.1